VRCGEKRLSQLPRWLQLHDNQAASSALLREVNETTDDHERALAAAVFNLDRVRTETMLHPLLCSIGHY
jgi:hypothetical protein